MRRIQPWGLFMLLAVVAAMPTATAADKPAPPPKPGTGGRFTPNWDRPCERAEISSLGRSATDEAATKSWCCGALLWAASSDTATTANGLATARAATALIVVESLRRRRFGTEVSSICFALRPAGPSSVYRLPDRRYACD
jgi:hypothetical protein